MSYTNVPQPQVSTQFISSHVTGVVIQPPPPAPKSFTISLNPNWQFANEEYDFIPRLLVEALTRQDSALYARVPQGASISVTKGFHRGTYAGGKRHMTVSIYDTINKAYVGNTLHVFVSEETGLLSKITEVNTLL